MYLEKPLWILFVVHRVIEIFRSSTEEVAVLSVGQSPAYCPVGCGADEGVQHVLDKDVDGVLGPETEMLNNIKGLFYNVPHSPCFKKSKSTLHDEDHDAHDDKE